MDTPSTFGKRLQTLMTMEGLAVGELATQMDRSDLTIQRYLTQGIKPKTDFILKLLQTYPHWSANYLLSGVGDMVKASHRGTNTDNNAGGFYWWRVWRVLQEDKESLPIEGLGHLADDALQQLGRLLNDIELEAKEVDRLSQVLSKLEQGESQRISREN